MRVTLLAAVGLLALGATPAAAASTCDPLDPSACLYPWPNNAFTKRDAATQTNLRLDLPRSGMPANAAGAHIDPTEWNRSDGFSPGSALITRVPGSTRPRPSASRASSRSPTSAPKRARTRPGSGDRGPHVEGRHGAGPLSRVW